MMSPRGLDTRGKMLLEKRKQITKILSGMKQKDALEVLRSANNKVVEDAVLPEGKEE